MKNNMTTETTVKKPRSKSRDYVRFIVLTAARTGSYMLTSSLNSSPNVICFGELFNPLVKHVDYRVDGYDMTDAGERRFQDNDLERFLAERIFCERDGQIGAVGFKAPHLHFWAYGDVEEWLVRNQDIHVIHLRRRNLLRMMLSLRIAMKTWGWTDYQLHSPASVFRTANIRHAFRHPLKALRVAKAALLPRKPEWKDTRSKVALSVDECRQFFAQEEADATHFDARFENHPKLTVYYEELCDDYKRTMREIQKFLSLEPTPVTPLTRQQNPEPLRELIANYDELYAAFSGTGANDYFA